MLVLVPIELGVMLRAGRATAHRIRSVVPYRRPLPLRDWLWLVPVLIVAAFIGFGLSMAIEPAVIDAAVRLAAGLVRRARSTPTGSATTAARRGS